MRGSDFNGWVPPEIKVLGTISALAVLYVLYRIGDWLFSHLSIHWFW